MNPLFKKDFIKREKDNLKIFRKSIIDLIKITRRNNNDNYFCENTNVYNFAYLNIVFSVAFLFCPILYLIYNLNFCFSEISEKNYFINNVYKRNNDYSKKYLEFFTKINEENLKNITSDNNAKENFNLRIMSMSFNNFIISYK